MLVPKCTEVSSLDDKIMLWIIYNIHQITTIQLGMVRRKELTWGIEFNFLFVWEAQCRARHNYQSWQSHRYDGRWIWSNGGMIFILEAHGIWRILVCCSANSSKIDLNSSHSGLNCVLRVRTEKPALVPYEQRCPWVVTRVGRDKGIILKEFLGTTSCRSQSQNYFTTEGESVSMYWCRAHSGTSDQILLSVWKLLSCVYGAPSLRGGRVCSFQCNQSLVWVAQNP
jgi:hypothetical protein